MTFYDCPNTENKRHEWVLTGEKFEEMPVVRCSLCGERGYQPSYNRVRIVPLGQLVIHD